MQQKNSWFGGLIMCVFASMILFMAHDTLPLFGVVLLSLMILCGVWAVVSSFFGLDSDSAWFWLVGAVVAVGFAGFTFLLAGQETDFKGGIPFIPTAWNSVIARLLFAFGGLISLFMAVVFSLKAREIFKKDDDDVD